jgi:lysophospholipase L1-like esterase
MIKNSPVHLALAAIFFAADPVSSIAEEYSIALPLSDDGIPGTGMFSPGGDRFKARWNERRTHFESRREQDRGALFFVGDSITQGWGDDFRGYFDGVKIANRGIGGDTSRGVIYRLQRDVLSLDPSGVIILIGTNELGGGAAPEVIASDMEVIVSELKKHSAEMPIIINSMFPSSEAKRRPSETIQEVNRLVAEAMKGDPQVTLLDTFTLFADGNGDSKAELFPDRLHLNEEGYAAWAASLRPLLATFGYVDTEADKFEIEEGFESLFNGKDLTGWGFRITPPRKQPKKPRPNAPVWVEISEPENFDGKVASSDGRYQVVNERLVVTTPAEGRRIQQLWTQREFPNDFTLRLEFRATPNADSGVFIRQPQLQCRDYALAGPYTELEAYRPQDWNELEVVVTGGMARATCNGELLEEEWPVPSVGPIGLEGDRGQMEYRRIRMRED